MPVVAVFILIDITIMPVAPAPPGFFLPFEMLMPLVNLYYSTVASMAKRESSNTALA